MAAHLPESKGRWVCSWPPTVLTVVILIAKTAVWMLCVPRNAVSREPLAWQEGTWLYGVFVSPGGGSLGPPGEGAAPSLTRRMEGM